MPIEIDCPQCRKTLVIPDKYRGLDGKCNHCGVPVYVPTIHEEQAAAIPSQPSRGNWFSRFIRNHSHVRASVTVIVWLFLTLTLLLFVGVSNDWAVVLICLPWAAPFLYVWIWKGANVPRLNLASPEPVELDCPHCGGDMVHARKAGCAIPGLLLVGGIIIAAVPFIGPPLFLFMLLAAVLAVIFCGPKFWKCTTCGSTHNRM